MFVTLSVQTLQPSWDLISELPIQLSVTRAVLYPYLVNAPDGDVSEVELDGQSSVAAARGGERDVRHATSPPVAVRPLGGVAPVIGKHVLADDVDSIAHLPCIKQYPHLSGMYSNRASRTQF